MQNIWEGQGKWLEPAEAVGNILMRLEAGLVEPRRLFCAGR